MSSSETLVEYLHQIAEHDWRISLLADPSDTAASAGEQDDKHPLLHEALDIIAELVRERDTFKTARDWYADQLEKAEAEVARLTAALAKEREA